MSGLPEALVEVLLRYFGRAALPDFSQTLAIFGVRPYSGLRDSLSSRWDLDDLSDANHDLGWRWWLKLSDGRAIDVRLSFVGPYYLVLDETGEPTTEADVVSLLESAGFHLLDRRALEAPVRIWEPEVGGLAYEFIFEFDNGLPWQ